MAKRKKVVRSGRLVKAIAYTVPQPRDSEYARAEKSKFTSDARRILNYVTAQGRLEMILAANFGPKDMFCTLTYRDEDLPSSHAIAKDRVREFLTMFRKQRKRRGGALKYVYVTEGKHGDRRYHHHLVIDTAGADDLETIRSLWRYGDVVDVEQIGDRAYIDVARYITKENAEDKPVGAQMWTPSKGLVRPAVESTFIDENETIQPEPGATVLERKENTNEFGTYYYLKYLLPVEREPFRPRPPYKRKRAIPPKNE